MHIGAAIKRHRASRAAWKRQRRLDADARRWVALVESGELPAAPLGWEGSWNTPTQLLPVPWARQRNLATGGTTDRPLMTLLGERRVTDAASAAAARHRRRNA